MTTSAKYNYPLFNNDMRTKVARIEHATKLLEANEIKPEGQSHNKYPKFDLESSTYLDDLNPAQRLAATTLTGKTLLIAGAGSGKTQTLTYRTSHLIEQGIPAGQILLLTFTRKSANEITTRAQLLLQEQRDTKDGFAGSTNITSGTFHSFCNRLLRQYSGLLGIDPRFTILDTGDAEDAIDLVMKEKKYPIDRSKTAFPKKSTLQKLFYASRNRRIDLTVLIEDGYPDSMIHIDIIKQLAKDYHHYKRANNLYDFDDIISQVVKHLRDNPKFRTSLQKTYRHVMVDEYQDTNVPQKQLIDFICEPEDNSLMVVGDDNQSIYAFRGANYENILLFGETYPDAKLIKLEQNYRSTPAILDFTNALAKQITLGYHKTLFSSLPVDGVRPQFIRCSDESKEAEQIADTVLRLIHPAINVKSELDSQYHQDSDIPFPDIAKQNNPNQNSRIADDEVYSFEDMAVLCRTSYQTNHVQLEFAKRQIPFIVVGGIKFMEKRHIKDVLAFMKIIYNPSDVIAWHRTLTMLPGIGDVTAGKLVTAIQENDNSFEPLLDPKMLKRSKPLSEMYVALSKAREQSVVVDIITTLLEYYVPMLKTLEENWRERREDFAVLLTLAEEHDSLEDFLENLALDPPNDSIATQNDTPSNTDVVTISTIHSAKGLEWLVVFVNHLIDGVMPHRRSRDDFEQLEEERKLFYVACSRAKRRLYLSAPRYISSYTGYFDQVSRFITEVEDHVDMHDSEQTKSFKTLMKSDDPEWW